MDKKRIEDIKEYLYITGCLSNNFGPYSKVYSMTTENIGGFLTNYDLKNKSVLSVAGSGDQRLNAYLLGAENVTCFDINPITKLQLNLKDKIIEKVNYEKFIKFFGIYSRRYGDYYECLDMRIFEEVINDIDSDTYDFFEYVINNDCISSEDIYFRFLNSLNKLKKMNLYLEEDNYYKLSEIIKSKDLDFIESDIACLEDKIRDRKYDFILLSNISDYIHEIYSDDCLENYYELVKSLSTHLNDDGIMQVGYIYGTNQSNADISCFNDGVERRKVFGKDEFDLVYVDPYDNIRNKDKVIVYKKGK